LRLPFHTPEEVRGWIEKAAPADIALVATVDDQIVGVAGLHRLTGRQAHVGQIGMGVHDDWTGKGIGTRLLAALIDPADRWLGLRRLQLTVFSDNEPAIRLYRRFGFEVEGTHREFALRDGALVDALVMARLGRPWRGASASDGRSTSPVT
jgi:L-phenylalanine/L-methionine N-acetyltransferase